MERTCPTCGTVNYDDQATSCVNCGGELPGSEDTVQAQVEEAPQVEVAADKMLCPECGSQVGAEAEKCPSCSADLSHTIRCPSCGKGVDELAEICPNCFNSIAKPAAEEKWDTGAVGAGKGIPEELKAEEKLKEKPAKKAEEKKPEAAPKEKAPKKTEQKPAKKAEEKPKRAPAKKEPEERPKKRFGFGKKKDEEDYEALTEDEEGSEEDEEGLTDEELAKKRREDRKRKIKDILDEEKSESFFNYYRLSTITLFFFVFFALFTIIEFALFAFNITNKVPRALMVFSPVLGGVVSVGMLIVTAVLATIDAALHIWDRKMNLLISIMVSIALVIGIGITAAVQSGEAANIDYLFSIILILVILFMVIIDFICFMNYPAVLEDPGRSQFELYIDKEDDMDRIITDLQEEHEKEMQEEEEKLRMKEEEMLDIMQKLEALNEAIAQEEEKVRLKEQEISAIKSELDTKTEALASEEEKLRMKEQEMESLVKAEVDKRQEDFMMEEEERIRMKEQELIKARSDLEIQRNLFDESREKLRMKETELSTLKQELENQIRQRLEEEEKLKLKAAAGRMLEKTKQKRVLFPFVALVGQEKMKKAMILNAIYPEIGGVLIRGQKGTGKSVGVRGLAEVLPDIEVTGCKFNCDPKDVDKLCADCTTKYNAGKLETFTRPVQVVDLPLNITEDRLVGSIDIEKILSEGTKSFEPGILAEAHRGILYVDEINLLDDYIVDILLDSASSGMVNIEREGISITHPSRFIIVGSMNPEEGELRPQILDRIALQTDVVGIQDVGLRIEIVKRREAMTVDPERFREQHEPVRKELRERITKARELLPNVRTPKHIYDLIAQICIDFNVDGHRADIIIERAARANAAFEGRLEASAEDVAVGAEMALPHRMRRTPYEEEEFSEEMLMKLVKKRELEILEGSRRG